MNNSTGKEIAARLVPIITDAFNRSINALEKAGAIDTKRMRKHYAGIGSKYYDVVTEQIELTVKTGAPSMRQLFTQGDNSTGET